MDGLQTGTNGGRGPVPGALGWSIGAPTTVAVAAPTAGAIPASTTAAPGSTANPAAAAAKKAADPSTKPTAGAAATPTSTAPPARLQPDAGSYPLAIAGTSSVDGRSTSVPGSAR